MKNVLPLALLLIAIAIALFIFMGNEPALDYEAEAPSGPVEPRSGAGDLTHEGLVGRAPDEDETPKVRDNSHLMKTHKTRYGVLEILVIGPDGTTVPSDRVKVQIEPLGRSHRIGPPAGLRDPESHLWTFPKVPIGAVNITVSGEFVIRAEDSTKVREGVTTEKKVFVEVAGSIKYDVKLYDGTYPEEVTLTLLKGGKPVAATYQVRTREYMTNATHTKSITQKPFGYIFGVRAGTYQLRARSPEEETETVTVDVERGKETIVALEVRR